MNRNIIDAIGTLIKRRPIYLTDEYSPDNPGKSARYLSIEEYAINLFADSFNCSSTDELIERHVEVFAHFGNSINPPDLILRSGDAIEIKNIRLPERVAHEKRFPEAYKSSPLILNTVYPRQKLFVDDPLVTDACRRAGRWKVRDIIYAIGVSQGKRLTHLCMVYGVDYCASAEHYKKILAEMRARLEDMPNISFSDERYLGRVKDIDPTGATYLDLRNMWYLENPWSFFDYVYKPNPRAEFNFMCIINAEKFSRLENGNKLWAWAEICDGLTVSDIRIRNPDAPKQFRDALLIRYEV